MLLILYTTNALFLMIVLLADIFRNIAEFDWSLDIGNIGIVAIFV